MYKIFLILLILLTLSSGCRQVVSTNFPANVTIASIYNHTAVIKNKELRVQIVSESEEMQQGLSNRNSMTENEGMLFDFGSPATRPVFWMSGMKFDLDFIWIKDKKIISITPNVPAPVGNGNSEIGNLPTYSPPSDVDMVLEVNSGWCEKNDIKIGDPIKISN